MKTRVLSAAITVVCAIVVGSAAIETRFGVLAARQAPRPEHPTGAGGHSIVAPDALKWRPVGTGTLLAVLDGAPDKEGVPFVIRLKLAGGTRVPPHWHPTDEHLTVISGTFYMGTGEKFDEATATALTTGTYAMMPKEVRHFGWTGVETVVQIHGVGPFKTYFVEQPAK